MTEIATLIEVEVVTLREAREASSIAMLNEVVVLAVIEVVEMERAIEIGIQIVREILEDVMTAEIVTVTDFGTAKDIWITAEAVVVTEAETETEVETVEETVEETETELLIALVA